MSRSPLKMGSKAGKTLLYRDIALKLRERILSGHYPPNTKLPSLHELTAQFGVSTISVRRALRELTNEDLIYGEQGRGAFVKSKGVIHRILPASSSNSEGDAIAAAGFAPGMVELQRDRIPAREDVAQRLGIKPGTLLHRHEKMVFADDQPVSFHTLYFPRAISRRLQANLDSMFVFRLLHEAKLEVGRTRFEFGAQALTSEHMNLFRLPVGYPMGVAHFTPIAKDGRPILTGSTIFRSDRFLYEITAPIRNS